MYSFNPSRTFNAKQWLVALSCRDDIVRSIKTLKPLSSGFEIITIGKKRLVRSVPKELDTDQSSLLLLAQVRCPPERNHLPLLHGVCPFVKAFLLTCYLHQTNGYVDKSAIEKELRWHEGRVTRALVSCINSRFGLFCLIKVYIHNKFKNVRNITG